jgi:hypothetical protein
MEELLLSLGISLFVVCLFWPKQENWPTDDYLALLSPTEWKEEAKIYEEILRLHPMLTLNEHNHILLLLHDRKEVERRVVPPHAVQEIESPNRFGRTYTDHIEPFCGLVSVNYKLADKHKGKQIRNYPSNLAPSYANKR